VPRSCLHYLARDAQHYLSQTYLNARCAPVSAHVFGLTYKRSFVRV
jgi:hypothetical protein